MKTPMREGLNSTIGTNRKSNQSNSQNTAASLNNSINMGPSTANFFDHKTFVKIYHGDNKLILLNSLCTCLHMLNHLKEQLHLNKDDQIDLMDFDGTLKDIPNLNNKDYAIQYLVPANSYVILKIEIDSNTNEKKYTSLLNELRLNTNMLKTLATLNTGKNLTAKDRAKITREQRMKQQQLQQQQAQQDQQQSTTSSSQKPTTAAMERQTSQTSPSNSSMNNSSVNQLNSTNTGRKTSKIK